MIFLDTDVCVAYLRGNELIKAKFRKFEPGGLAVSSMTAAELLYGAEKSDDPDGSRMRVEEFLGSLNVVYGNENAIRTFGYVKAYLVRAGLAIPDADILVAAVGHAGAVTPEFVTPSQIVLDVGINVNEAGKLCGDVAPKAAELAGAYTPVPGGVGSVTTTVLMKHVVEATKKQSGINN